LMALANVWVLRSKTAAKLSFAASTTLAFLYGLVAALHDAPLASFTSLCAYPLVIAVAAPLSSFSAMQSASTLRGSFELFANCLVATLLPNIVARFP
jgi:hypothetical protein